MRQDDADARLDLQAIVEQCHQRGRYEQDLNYEQDPEPPLEGADAAWAEELLIGAGLRKRRRHSRKNSRSRKPR